jgi:hypothetical protein
MPYSSDPFSGYEEEEFVDPFSMGFGAEGEDDGGYGESIWFPGDPDPLYSPTPEERADYREEMGRMAGVFMRNNLGWTIDPRSGATIKEGFAQAYGTSGEGGGSRWGSYRPASLGWTRWGDYEPKSKISLSSWGWNYGLRDPFPILGGSIVSPTIDIRTKKDPEGGRHQYRVSSAMRSGREEAASIMKFAGEKGQAEMKRLLAQDENLSIRDAGLMAEKVARQSVRNQTQAFARADFGERWSYPYGLRKAIEGSANIRFHGDYSLGPKDLFGELGKLGFFTKSTSPSVEADHPERGAWQGYSLDTLYHIGWLRSADGSFITGSNKPSKRRQLGVQRLASPFGGDHNRTVGRVTGDSMISATAVFVDNYAYSEGSGVVDSGLAAGFREYRPKLIEKPQRAGDDWEVRFQKGGFLGRGRPKMGKAGEDIFIGEQRINGEWEPLESIPGTEGVSQRLWGHRKIENGYQVLLEREHPFESGMAKLMHYGMKALLFKAPKIISEFQGIVRSAKAAGALPSDVADPRMVLPMPKDWTQTEFGMFDHLPSKVLRGMGLSQDLIDKADWQAAGPEVIDKMKKFAEDRRFEFSQQHEMPVSRLGAFTNAGNASDISYFEKNGKEWARFTARHTGYALPIAAGIRMEYAGKKPMYSPEELMQIAQHFPDVAKNLMSRGNSASRIWGVAAASAAGVMPQDVVSHDMLPWMSARLGIDGDLEDEGTSRILIENLGREMRNRGLGRSAILAPDGSLLPAPQDVMSKSIKGLSGQEQSTFVSQYIQAMKLIGTGQDPTEALATFSGSLQSYSAGHNVRREALGARLKNSAEGTFTSHYSIPDDTVVAGDSVLRKLAGINRKDPDAGSKLEAFINQIENGESPFYVLGTRRPVSDMFSQLGVPMKVITERMAEELYDVPIEGLGRSYAVSPTVAAVWRGDVDADRALLHAATTAQFEKSGFIDTIGESGEVSRMWDHGAVKFHTSREVRDAALGKNSIMYRQIEALRMNAPDEYNKYVDGLDANRRAKFERGDTLALSEAVHGIDVDWNESKKWSDELRINPGKNLPMDYAYYSDASKKGSSKTVFTREEMLDDFEKSAKSKMLMGRGYNRYLRGLTSLAESPEELRAAVTFASGIYQKALDNQKMTKGELMLFNAMEAWGASGAMFDKFGKEEGLVGGGSAITGGAVGLTTVLATAIADLDAPPSVRAMLFSRDPAIRSVVAAGGNATEIIRAIGSRYGEVKGASDFLYDPSKAGILTQLVQSMHYSKASIVDTIAPVTDQRNKAAMQRYSEKGNRIRSMTRILGRGEKDGLPLAPYTKKGMDGENILMPGAIGDIRNMGGLEALADWQIAIAKRIGVGEGFFAGPEAWKKLIEPREDGGEVNPGKTYMVGEEAPEVFIPKSPGDIMKLPPELQQRLRMAPDVSMEFAKIVDELTALNEARKPAAAQNPAAGIVPPAAAAPGGFSSSQRQAAADALKWAAEHRAARAQGQAASSSPASSASAARAFQDLDDQEFGPPPPNAEAFAQRAEATTQPGGLAQRVFDELGGESVFRGEIEAIRDYKGARSSRDPMVMPNRLTRQAVNRMYQLGATNTDMQEWAGLMSKFGVGFAPQTTDGPDGPMETWSHSYGQAATETLAASPVNVTQDYINDAVSRHFFEKNGMLHGEGANSLISALINAQPTGKQLRLNMHVSPGGSYSLRTTIADMGLEGPAGAFLADNMEAMLADPRSKATQRLMADAVRMPGIGKSLTANMRQFLGNDLGAAVSARNPKAALEVLAGGSLLRHAMTDEVVQDFGPDIDQNPFVKREEAAYEALDEIERLSAEDRQVAVESLSSAVKRSDFDFERLAMRDHPLAKQVRTFGQRPSDEDLARMSPEDQRTAINRQRDAMVSIRDRAGRLGIEELGYEFDTIQDQFIDMGERNFASQTPAQRNALAATLSTAASGVPVATSLTPPVNPPMSADNLARQFADRNITAPQLRMLLNAASTNSELAELPSTPTNATQRMKLLNEQQGHLLTAISMNEKGEVPKELVDALVKNVDATRQLSDDTREATKVQQERVEKTRQQIEADPRYQQGQAALSEAITARASGVATPLTPSQVERFKNLGNLRKAGGMATDDIEELFEASGVESALSGIADPKKKSGFRAALNSLLGGGNEEGAGGGIGGIFTEMTLGFTAFRARMAWNLTTGAQKGWMRDFLGEEQSAIGAALAGGAVAGPNGSLSPFIASQAAIANTRAQVGEGVAQVYSPLVGMIGGMNMGAFAGAGATLLGTPLGAGAVAGMGAKMIAGGLGATSSTGAALAGAAGPIGMGVAALTFAGLSTSYLHGLGENWTTQPKDSVGGMIGALIRPGQVLAEQGGLPSVVGTIGGLAPLANYIISGGTQRFNYDDFFPKVAQQLADEKAAVLPGTLQGDAQGLRDYIRSEYGNRVNVDEFLGLTGAALQLGGGRAQDLYTLDGSGNSGLPAIDMLLKKWATYIEGGASPSELISSQLAAVSSAGVPLGTQSIEWMNQFADRIPGEQRQIYEQAFQALSPLSSVAMRPTTFEEAERVVALAESTGSMQRATNMVMSQGGIGSFTGTFGIEQEGSIAGRVGSQLSAFDPARQETILRYGGTVAQSASRMGMTAEEASSFSTLLGFLAPDDVLPVSNLVVQAESVALEAGKDGQYFKNLVLESISGGMIGRTAPEQRFFMAAKAGIAGLAPQSMMPASEQAEDFERGFALMGRDDQRRLSVAASILNDIYPSGYSQSDLETVSAHLGRGVSISNVSLGTRAIAGKAGIAQAMGMPAGSPIASEIDVAAIGTPGNERMTDAQRQGFAGMLNARNFQFTTGNQMPGMMDGLTRAYADVESGRMSAYNFDRVQQAASRSTPWGYSTQFNFGQGSLTDELERGYGQYTSWQSNTGETYQSMFSLGQAASYAGLGYASASNAAQSRQFARQAAQTRREWGSGPFQPLEAVQAAIMRPKDSLGNLVPSINLTGKPGDEGYDAASEIAVSGDTGNLNVGGSSIGFAQQESAIRRQMWQESISAQQQSIAFSRQSLEISRQELAIARQEAALSRDQYAAQREHKLSEQQAQRGMQLRQFEWSAEDYSIKVERTGISQQWQMEDMQRQRRYSFGRQRVELERNIERAQITQGWERDDTNRSRDRELEVQRYQNERYEAAVSFEQKLHDLQMRRFELQDQRMALQDQRLALQDAQLSAQEARMNANVVLQEKLNQLEEERFKAQYEQTQAQLEDDEKMEKLRKATRDIEIAFQQAQLVHAKTMMENEEKFLEGLKGVEENGVLDKWIEFFNLILSGPPGAEGASPEGVKGNTNTGGGINETRQGFVTVTNPVGETSISNELSATSGTPTIVNFVLDGEVVMSALVKPERLRPVVQEIQKRDSWR